MKFEIVNQKKNPLLKREEVMLTVKHEGKPTPSRVDLLSPLSKELKSNKDLVLIDKIFSVKGSQTSQIKAFVFEKKEDIPKEKLEVVKKRMEKSKEKAEEKKEAAPQEAGKAPAAEGTTPEGGEKPEGKAEPVKDEKKEELKTEKNAPQESAEKPKEEKTETGGKDQKPEEKNPQEGEKKGE